MTCDGCKGVGILNDPCTQRCYRCALCDGKGVVPDKPPDPLGSASNPGTPIVGYVVAGRTLHTFEDETAMQRFIDGTAGSGVGWIAAANVDRHVRWIGRFPVADSRPSGHTVNPDVPSPTPSDWDLMEAES